MRPADVDHGVMTLRDTLRRPRGGATTSDSLGRQGQSYASQRENSQLQCTCNAFVIHRAIHHDSPHFTTRLRIFDSQRGFSLAARAPSALSIVCRFPAILGQINNPKLSLGNIKLYHQIVIEHIEPFQILNMFFSFFLAFRSGETTAMFRDSHPRSQHLSSCGKSRRFRRTDANQLIQDGIL
jgi:hypothetical protein